MSRVTLLLVLTAAVGLTMVFFGPLWRGTGLIGGDLYSYFFPQKVVYAELLAAGEWPLWNDRVGFGYPLLAESQTGVLYPPNPLLYRLLAVNTAYNVSQLAHYVAAFVFTWLLMRRLDLSGLGATLAAVVFVYGWFPPRICLEWAIIGGVYLPLCLWCVESYWQSGGGVSGEWSSGRVVGGSTPITSQQSPSTKSRWLLLLSAALGVHLLAGHFNLAFITLLTLVAYAGLRVWGSGSGRGSDARRLRQTLLPFAVALLLGFLLGAVQLLPTWELKRLSQRDEVGAHHDPGYGHIPPWYLSQIVAPWWWYPADMDPDRALANTNKVEAHLYFGMLPLALIVYRLAAALLGGSPLDRRHRYLLWLGLAAMVYATGWLLPVTQHLPGFSFFMGPGRYGIVTTLASAVLCGAGFDRVVWRRRPAVRGVMFAVVVVLTVGDLLWVSRRVGVTSIHQLDATAYATMVEDVPLNHREESDVRGILSQSGRPVRMWAPGANLASLTGFATVPVYLGLGPAAYYDPQLAMPEPDPKEDPSVRAETLRRQKEWLSRAAVTHVLRMEPLDAQEWPEARLVWQGFDPLLNRAWGRFQEPLFLYELMTALPRVRLESTGPTDRASLMEHRANHVSVKATTEQGGRLVLAELAYPGWEVRIDGRPAQPLIDEGLFRAVDVPAGEHVAEWNYSPQSLWWGAVMSGIGLVVWIALLLRTWRRGAES